MAEGRYSFSDKVLGALGYYRQVLSDSITLYDTLEALYPQGTVADCNIFTERKGIRDLDATILELIENKGGSVGDVSKARDQIRQVNKSLIYISEDASSKKLFIEGGLLHQNNVDIRGLIDNNKLTIELFEKILRETPGEPTKLSDIGMAFLKASLPPVYGAFVVYGEIKKALEGNKSTLDAERNKYKPGSSQKRSPSVRPVSGITPSLGEIPKETIGSFSQTTSTSAPVPIKEKSVYSSFGDVPKWEKERPIGGTVPTLSEEAQKVSKEHPEHFMRFGKPYQPVRNEKGQFTGGKVLGESPSAIAEEQTKNRFTSEEDNEKSFHDGLYRFFSKTAYEAKWTAELLDAVTGKGVKGEKEKGKGLSLAELAAEYLLIKNALGTLGKVIGKAFGEMGKILGGIGQAVGKVASSAASNIGSKLASSVTGPALASTAIGTAAIGSAAVMGGLLNNAWTEETINTTKLADANDAYAFQQFLKVNNMNRKKKGLLPTGHHIEASRSTTESVANVSENAPKNKVPQRVPADNFISEHQTGNGPLNVDKLYTILLEMSAALKDFGKSTSTKGPSGYDANNTRNPVLSSLGAGQLDIA